MDRIKARNLARAHWTTHPIDESEGEDVQVEVKRPLSVMLSLRLNEEDYERLKLLSKAQKTGITTTARSVLHEALSQPGRQLLFQAMDDEAIKAQLSKLWSDSQIPQSGDPTFLIIPIAELRRISELMQQRAQQMWMEAIEAKSTTVTPRERLYDEIKEFQSVR